MAATPGRTPWTVQLLVQAVFVNEGGMFRDCTTGVSNARANARPADNMRYLKLTSDIKRGDTVPTPAVTYTPRTGVRRRPAEGRRGQLRAMGIQDTLNELKPIAPVLVEVKRNVGKENAYSDGAVLLHPLLR